MTSSDLPLPPIARTLHISDAASAWADAGFHIADGSVNLGALTLRLERPVSTPTLGFDRSLPTGSASSSVLPWIVDTATMTDGPLDGFHPNGISEIDHIVLMAPDQQGLRHCLDNADLEIRRERPASIAGNNVIQFFVWAGPVLLEIVAPATSQVSVAAEQQITVWGIAVIADDIESTVAWFGENSSSARPAVQPGRSIATLRSRQLNLGLTVAVMSGHDSTQARRQDERSNPTPRAVSKSTGS